MVAGAYAEQLNNVACDAGLDPSDRVAELRRLRDQILSEADLSQDDDRDLLGQVDTYLSSAELEREAQHMAGLFDQASLREDAEIRDVLISQGHATADELSALGWMSHDDIDAAKADGSLVESLSSPTRGET